jgi:hypothetical protein
MKTCASELLMKLGAARDQSRIAWRLVVIEVAAACATFSYRLDRNKLRQTRSREGRYLLRTNLVEVNSAKRRGLELVKDRPDREVAFEVFKGLLDRDQHQIMAPQGTVRITRSVESEFGGRLTRWLNSQGVGTCSDFSQRVRRKRLSIGG